MIHLEGIWKTYQMGEQTLHALKDVTHHIAAREHVAIMGPSGSGKSTLLNIIGCLDRPTRGRYTLDGQGVAELESDALAQLRLQKLGFIFQAFHLIPRFDALANVTLPMIFAGLPKREREERASQALESVGLSDWRNHRPAELSGGQKQRVAIARAIVMQPPVLLADEPTGNLDTDSGAQVLELLCGLNQTGITLLTVTHDPNVARLADRVIVLRDGEIAREVAGHEVADLRALFATDSESEHQEASGS